jgi:DNA processing protein
VRPADSTLAAWLKVTLTLGVPARAQLALARAPGCIEALHSMPESEIAAIVGSQCARALKGPGPETLDAVLAWLERPGNHFITLHDEAYPPLLRQISLPPPVLYVRGRLDLLKNDAIAIVGSRNASFQAQRDAQAFGSAFAAHGLTVVSGMALGVDCAAHRGGLSGKGSSVAVLGTGADVVYPQRNLELAEALAEDGTLVSEFPLGTRPIAGNFPRRNRLISGLARGVLVVEAALSSGSLITARFAVEQGRDVFAIPGSIHSACTKGCHQLLKEGAKLVETAEDVLEELNWPIAEPMRSRSDLLLDAMGDAPVCIDDLVERTGEDAPSVMAQVTMLELEGCIEAVAGGFFQRISAH